jgi:hypothetical protein
MDLRRALDDPAGSFEKPWDVLRSEGLTREEKVQILRRWEYDARLLEVAQEENMMGTQPSLLGDILDALHALEATDGSTAPTKQGGA